MLLFNLSQVYPQEYHIVIIVIQPFFIGQVHPQEYQADMTAILGFVLKHDDSVNDRTEVNHGVNQKIIINIRK